MGRKYRDLVRSYNGPRRSARHVLSILADYADDSGLAWPGQETIAREAGLSIRATQYAIQNLIEGQHIEQVSGGDGRGHVVTYRLILKGASLAGFDAKRVQVLQGSGVQKGASFNGKGASYDEERVQVSTSSLYIEPTTTTEPTTTAREYLDPVITQPPAVKVAQPPPTVPTPVIDLELPNPPTELDMQKRQKSNYANGAAEVDAGTAAPGRLVKPGTGIDAYWILREYTARSMTSRQMAMIRETATDLALWRTICERWSELYGDGWRTFGHLDWYRAGGPPGRPGTASNGRREFGILSKESNEQANSTSVTVSPEQAAYFRERFKANANQRAAELAEQQSRNGRHIPPA